MMTLGGGTPHLAITLLTSPSCDRRRVWNSSLQQRYFLRVICFRKSSRVLSRFMMRSSQFLVRGFLPGREGIMQPGQVLTMAALSSKNQLYLRHTMKLPLSSLPLIWQTVCLVSIDPLVSRPSIAIMILCSCSGCPSTTSAIFYSVPVSGGFSEKAMDSSMRGCSSCMSSSSLSSFMGGMIISIAVLLFLRMKVLALISGGKDSIYNLCNCLDKGHEVVALGNLYNVEQEGKELDSYMYQTVGTNATLTIAEALQRPIYRRPIIGKPKVMTLEYKAEEGDEVEDLQLLIQDVLKAHPQINAVSSGAIFSTYQKLRVEDICNRHGLTSLAYLWHRNQKELLQEMIDYKMEAILIKVACFGLNKTHLNRSIHELSPYFDQLYKECEMNVCGEGGEYESLVLDCPHYKQRIVVKEVEVVEVDTNELSPTAYLRIVALQLVPK